MGGIHRFFIMAFSTLDQRTKGILVNTHDNPIKIPQNVPFLWWAHLFFRHPRKSEIFPKHKVLTVRVSLNQPPTP